MIIAVRSRAASFPERWRCFVKWAGLSPRQFSEMGHGVGIAENQTNEAPTDFRSTRFWFTRSLYCPALSGAPRSQVGRTLATESHLRSDLCS